jgi:hypothetical protein
MDTGTEESLHEQEGKGTDVSHVRRQYTHPVKSHENSNITSKNAGKKDARRKRTYTLRPHDRLLGIPTDSPVITSAGKTC